MRWARRTWAGFGRLLRAVAGAALLWLPTTVLAVFAGTYLWGVYETLLAPGVPVKIDYDAVGGKYHFKAASYQFNPRSKAIHISRAELRDPKNQLIASAERLDGLIDGQVYVLNGRGLWLQIDRNQKARFSVMDALPKPKEGPPTQFRADLSEVGLRYRDTTASPTLQTDVHTKRVTAEGDSDDFVARTDLDIEGSGQIAARVQYSAKVGTTVNLDVARGDYAPLAGHAARWVNLGPNPVAADKLNLAGPVKIVVPRQGPIHVNGKATGSVDRLHGRDLPDISCPFVVQFDESRLAGSVEAHTSDGLVAKFKGAVGWSKGLAALGTLDASVPSQRSLGKWGSSLNGAQFDAATFKGKVGWSAGTWMFDGNAASQAVRAQGQTLKSVQAKVIGSPKGVYARSVTALWQGKPIQGGLDVSPKTSDVKGYVRLNDLPTTLLGVPNLSGSGKGIAAFAVNRGVPKVDFEGTGHYAWRAGGKTYDLGALEVRAGIQGSILQVQRAVLTGDNGSYVATGSADLQKKSLALKVRGGGLELAHLDKRTEGLAFMDGTVSGNFSNPHLDAVVEGFGVGSGSRHLPALSAHVQGDASTLVIHDIVAKSGTSVLAGTLTVHPKSGVIAGTLAGNGIQASDWIDPNVVGTFDFPATTISGTLSNPHAELHLSGSKLAYQNYRADGLVGDIELKEHKIFFRNVAAQIGGGTLTADGVHNISEGFLNLNATLAGVDLASVVPPTEGVTVSGKISGKAQLGGSISGGAPRGQAQLNVDSLAINGVRVGSGTVRAGHTGERWVGKAEIGEDDRFLVADNVEWNAATKSIAGTLDGLNLKLAPIAEQVRLHISPEKATLIGFLKDLEGNADFSVAASGTSDKPVFALNQFEAKISKFQGQPAGTITATGQFHDGTADIQKAAWRLGDASASFKGSLDDKGFTKEADFEINNFDLKKLSFLYPPLDQVVGRATLSGLISGPYADPTATAGGRISLRTGNVTGLGARAPGTTDYDADILYNMEVARQKITLDGGYTAEGFSGKVSGTLPFSTIGLADPEKQVMALNATVAERPLKDFKSLLPNLDVKRSSGVLGGGLNVTKGPSGFGISGGLHLKGDQIAFEGIDQTIQNFDVHLVPSSKDVILTAQGTSSSGGSLAASLTAKIQSLLESSDRVDSLAQALELCALSGSVRTPGATPEKPGIVALLNDKSSSERIYGRINADIDISGNLRNPILAGLVQVYGLDTPILAPPASASTSTPVVDPIFGTDAKPFRFEVGDSARIRTTSGAVSMIGGGTVSGSLSAPVAKAGFTLQKGSFTLPNARIELQPGGTLTFNYVSAEALPFVGSGQPLARLDVDLEGRTSISVRKQTDVYERYDINLDITGDLLSQPDPAQANSLLAGSGLNINATSDPSDLSKDEILAALGQKELIEQLTSQVLSSSSGNTTPGQRPGLTGTAYQFLLPSLTGSITNSIAQGLGLDEISLDYNTYEQASVTASKALGKGLTLTLRRQLYDSPFVRNQYDLKLIYRLRTRSQDLSRLRFTFGFNQSVPWRFTIDYSIRY